MENNQTNNQQPRSQETLADMNWAEMPAPKDRESFEKWKPPIGTQQYEILDEKRKTVEFIDKISGTPKSFQLVVLTLKDYKGQIENWEVPLYENYSLASVIGQLVKFSEGKPLKGRRMVLLTSFDESKKRNITRIFPGVETV